MLINPTLCNLIPKRPLFLLISLLFMTTSAAQSGEPIEATSAPATEFDQLFDTPNEAVQQDVPNNEITSNINIAIDQAETPDTKVKTYPIKAQAHLDMIKSQLKKFTKGDGFFDNLFTAKSPFKQEIIREADEFIQLYGDIDLAAEAYDLKATLYEQENKNEFSVVALLHHLYIYGTAESNTHLIDKIQALLPNQNKDLSEALKSTLAGASDISGSRADRWSRLLQALPSLTAKEAKFNHATALSAKRFLLRHEGHPQIDLAQKVYADHSHDDNDIAIYQHQKLLAIYPDSIFRSDSILSIADIQRIKLKDYDGAVINYNVIINDYPDSTTIKPAYEFLALTYSKHLKNYAHALATLQVIIDKFNKDPIVMRALQSKADILNKKTKQYAEAVKTYQQLAAMFIEPAGLNALHKADKIASSKLKDYDLRIKINKTIVRDYPKHEDAPKSLYKIAETYQKKLNNSQQAIKIYQYLVKQYPSSSSAKKASRNIEKLTRQ